MIEELMRETFARHESLAPAPEPVRARIEAAATRRRRWRRGTAAVGGTAIALVALVVAVFIRPDALSTGPVVGASASATAAGVAKGPMTFLIIGTDRRPYSADLNRADTIMLAHLPADRSTPYLISIPRDQLVPFGDRQETLGGVYANGSAKSLRDSVQRLTGLVVDGAVEVDFGGLVAVTDAVGGVDLCVPRRIVSEHTQRIFEPGCWHFSGADAMDYLRQRRSFENGDLDRQKNGRAYVKALFKRLAGADIIDVLQVVRAGGGALRMDLGGSELAGLLAVVNELKPDDLVAIAPPATFDGLKPEAAQLWAAVRGGTLTDWVVANPNQVDQR